MTIFSKPKVGVQIGTLLNTKIGYLWGYQQDIKMRIVPEKPRHTVTQDVMRAKEMGFTRVTPN